MLKRQKIGKTAAVEPHGSHHGPGDNIAHLCALRFHVYTGIGNGDRVRLLTDLQGYIDQELGTYIDRQTGTLIRLKSSPKGLDFVTAHRKSREGVEAIAI